MTNINHSSLAGPEQHADVALSRAGEGGNESPRASKLEQQAPQLRGEERIEQRNEKFKKEIMSSMHREEQQLQKEPGELGNHQS